MIRVLVTIKILVLTNLHIILRVSHNNLTVVRSVEVRIIALIVKGSDEGNNEIDSLTKEPSDTLLMGDEVINTTSARENNEFIKSSVDDLVPILRESEVTSVCDNLECNMPFNTPLPTTDIREEDFDINSPLGGQVVDFLMENVYVADLPKHMVKQLFGLLVKNISYTKRISDEPLGDDSKPRSYDVTFSNPLFDFNDDFTLCNDNPLFDEEFKDISEVERFDLFFFLTQSVGKTRVMETASFSSHHMPLPRHAAYSPTKVMYRYYHPHLASCDGFDHGPKMK
ncbi:hypothetical protein Tco_1117755 [Tanacetum coccineum]